MLMQGSICNHTVVFVVMHSEIGPRTSYSLCANLHYWTTAAEKLPCFTIAIW